MDRTPGGFAENFEALWANCLAENDAISAACDSKAVPPPQRNTNEWSIEGDKAALLGFKDSGNGAGLESWTEKSDPCADAWAGVICDAVGAVVIGLDLSGGMMYDGPFHTLTGDIGLLGGLPSLTSLVVSSTHVTGDLAGFRDLVGLTHLDLDSCRAVTGDLADLQGLTGLTSLSMEKCAVSGDLTSLAGLVGLTQTRENAK